MPLIDVVTRSTDASLTTLVAVKQVLGLSTAATSDDVRLTATILAASRWAESYVGYPLAAQRYREILPGYGTRSLILARMPVRSVVSLWDASTTDSASEVATSEFSVNTAAGMLQRAAGWEWNVINEPWLTHRPLPGQEYPAWLVDYVAGYSLTGVSTGDAIYSTEGTGTTSTERTLPEDIEQAVITKAAGMFDGSESVTEEAVGDLRVRYAAGASGGQERAVDVPSLLLGPYRRMV